LQKKALCCLKVSEAANPVTQHHIPEDLIPQQHHSDNPKSPHFLKDKLTKQYTYHSKALICWNWCVTLAAIFWQHECRITKHCTDYAVSSSPGRFHTNTLSLLDYIYVLSWWCHHIL
jgi:hypothetical protein